VPAAVTENVTLLPTHFVWLTGCTDMLGAVQQELVVKAAEVTQAELVELQLVVA
jgi:hypothetical protein